MAQSLMPSAPNQLGLMGPVTLNDPGQHWPALQGTVHQFGHFLLEARAPARSSARSALTLPPSDLQVTVSSAKGLASLVRQPGGWVLQVDTRSVPGGTELPLTLTATSAATGRVWQRRVVVHVLATRVQQVQVPASGLTVNLGTLEVAFAARGRANALMPATIRWGQTPWSAATVVKVEPGPNATALPPLSLQSIAVAPAATAAPLVGSITDALDTTVPYSADDNNLGTLWQPFQACYIGESKMRLPAYDGDCVWTRSGELNGLLSTFWSPTDWTNVTPVLFLHGYKAHGSDRPPYPTPPYLGGGKVTFGNFPNLVRQHVGPGGRRFAPFEYRWNSDTQFVLQGQELASAINTIYETTGQPVIVVAHSFGGLLTRTVLQQIAAGNQASLAKARRRISAVMTLGTPHSGIADTETTMHGVSFPVGQDSFRFEGCSQVSCHVAGEPVVYLPWTLTRLGISADAGEDAAKIANTRGQLPAIRIAQGIGNDQDRNIFNSKWVYGTGDGLIAFHGQRFFPDDRGRAMRQWSVETGSGAILKEQLLGFVDGITLVAEGDTIASRQMVPGDWWAREYFHSPAVTDWLDGKGTEANIPADLATACNVPTTCQHASWRLLKEILGTGGKLNDTGQILCVDTVSNIYIPCAGTGQDGEFGRDVTANDASDGEAGFSYVKISASGAELPPSAPTWVCVKDRVSGLMWEVKNYSGPRGVNNLYTNLGNGSPGDASAFVQSVNLTSLCGYRDWRLPSRMELHGLVDYGKPGIYIDTAWFPYRASGDHWTGTGGPGDGSHAWAVNFSNGYVYYPSRYYSYAVRLVRSGQ